MSTGRRNFSGMSFCLALLGLFITARAGLAQTVAWTQTFNNSPSNGDDRVTAMTTDSDGNVYVAGFVWQRRVPCGGDYDYAVMKYTPTGTPAWAAPRIYSGPATGDDKPTGIALGSCWPGLPELCVYVTGVSAGSGSDYATIKLNASDGTYSSAWPNVADGRGVRRYSTGISTGDRANAIAVDQDGNAYVTGRVEGPRGSGIGTVAYDSTGAIPEGWPRFYQAYVGGLCRYAEGNSVALDETNHPQVYAVVAGVSSSSSVGGGQLDYAVVKYRGSDGNEEWARSVDIGTGDVATKVKVDSGGNIFVTGQVGDQGRKVMDCDIDCSTYLGAVNVDLNAVLGPQGLTNLDYGTIGYRPDGSTGWPLLRYNGRLESMEEATDERALDLVVDGNGDVIVTGYSGISADHDWATVKYRRSPWEQEWAQRVFSTSAGRLQDSAFAVTADSGNNVYVTGGFDGSGTLETATFRRGRTRQYDAAGATVGTYDYMASSVDNLTRTISLAPGNRIVVAGHTFNAGTLNDFLTIALDPPW